MNRILVVVALALLVPIGFNAYQLVGRLSAESDIKAIVDAKTPAEASSLLAKIDLSTLSPRQRKDVQEEEAKVALAWFASARAELLGPPKSSEPWSSFQSQIHYLATTTDELVLFGPSEISAQTLFERMTFSKRSGRIESHHVVVDCNLDEGQSQIAGTITYETRSGVTASTRAIDLRYDTAAPVAQLYLDDEAIDQNKEGEITYKGPRLPRCILTDQSVIVRATLKEEDVQRDLDAGESPLEFDLPELEPGSRLRIEIEAEDAAHNRLQSSFVLRRIPYDAPRLVGMTTKDAVMRENVGHVVADSKLQIRTEIVSESDDLEVTLEWADQRIFLERQGQENVFIAKFDAGVSNDQAVPIALFANDGEQRREMARQVIVVDQSPPKLFLDFRDQSATNLEEAVEVRPGERIYVRAQDAGAGVATGGLQVKIDNEGLVKADEATRNPNGDLSWALDLLDDAGGEITLTIQGRDRLGHESDSKTFQLRVARPIPADDNEGPSVRLTTVDGKHEFASDEALLFVEGRVPELQIELRDPAGVALDSLKLTGSVNQPKPLGSLEELRCLFHPLVTAPSIHVEVADRHARRTKRDWPLTVVPETVNLSGNAYRKSEELIDLNQEDPEILVAFPVLPGEGRTGARFTTKSLPIDDIEVEIAPKGRSIALSEVVSRLDAKAEWIFEVYLKTSIGVHIAARRRVRLPKP